MPGRGHHARAWAEEVEEEEEAASPVYDETTGQYRGSDSAWHEGIAVGRGISKHRLDTGHGFYRSIVRNQQEREAYEQSWQEAYKEAGPFQQRWGVGVKVPQAGRQESSAVDDRFVRPSNAGQGLWESPMYDGDDSRGPEPDEKVWWRRPVDVTQSSSVRVLQRSAPPEDDGSLPARQRVRAKAEAAGIGSSQRPGQYEESSSSGYAEHGGEYGMSYRASSSMSAHDGSNATSHTSHPPHPPPSTQTRAPMTHEQLEASLYNTHLSTPSQAPPPMNGTPYSYGAALHDHHVQYSSQQVQHQAPHMQQQHTQQQVRLPGISYDGIALGVPVYMSQPPSAGPPVVQQSVVAAPQQEPAAAPAGWAYDLAISGWGGRSLPPPQPNPLPAHNAHLQDHDASEAAKEKVRLGFQVYRPPPQLGQPSSLELETKKGKKVNDPMPAPARDAGTPPSAQPHDRSHSREPGARQSRPEMQQPSSTAQRRVGATEASQEFLSARAAAHSSERGPEQPAQRVREKYYGEREGRGSDKERPRAVPVHAADERGKAGRSGGQGKPDQAASVAGHMQHIGASRTKPLEKEQKSGSREPVELSRKAPRNEQQSSVERSVQRALGKQARPSGVSDADRPSRAAERTTPGPEQMPRQRSARDKPHREGTDGQADKRSADRKAAVTVASAQEVPPGFGSPLSTSRPAEERRRPAIGMIRSLVATQTDALPRPDKTTATKSAAAKSKPAAVSTADESTQTVKSSRRREKKERQAGAAAAGADGARRALTTEKQGSAAVDAPPGIDVPPELPLSSRQKKRLQRDQARESALQHAGETPPHGVPPGLEVPQTSSKAAAQVKGAGKGKAAAQATEAEKDRAGQSSASRALKQALKPAYFERPVKQQQEQTAKSAQSASAVDAKSPAPVADSEALTVEPTGDTAAGSAESAALPYGGPSIPEQPPERAALDGKATGDKAATTSEVTTSPSELQDFPLLVLPGPILQPKRPPKSHKLVKPEEQKPPAGPVTLGQKGQWLPRQPLGDIVAKMPWVEAPEAGGTSAAAVEGPPTWGPGEAQGRGNAAWSEAAVKATESRPDAHGFKRYWSSSEVSAQQKVSADEATPEPSPRVGGTDGEAAPGMSHRNGKRRGQRTAAQVEAEDPGEGSESGWGEPDRDANWDAAAARDAYLGKVPAEKSGPSKNRDITTSDSESRSAAGAAEAAPQDSAAELGRQGDTSTQEDTAMEREPPVRRLAPPNLDAKEWQALPSRPQSGSSSRAVSPDPHRA